MSHSGSENSHFSLSKAFLSWKSTRHMFALLA
jgi:hypothetical protein